MAAPADVDSYLAGFPPEQREILERVRQAIRSRVPDPVEKIRYGMPAIMLGGRYALHFAGWKKHLGLYPVPRLDDALEERLAPHRSEKDTVAFPWTRPVPYDLIEEVTEAIVARRGDGAGDSGAGGGGTGR
jgi:uncharacterized protein YdhG (YjbR/CyaY superfamily)